MYSYKIKAFVLLISCIFLSLGSILFEIDKEYKLAIKIFTVGIILIIVSIYERKRIKKTSEEILLILNMAVHKGDSKSLKN